MASNLGVVEITLALHRVFDLERDRLVFDVGHQGYVHKILSGRAGQMHTIRTFGGLSGFPKPDESPADAFVSGHASAAVSAALGMARARTLRGEDYHVIALLGDGALTGGLAYEGLSDAGQSGERMIVIFNDNGMSINKNVGAMSQRLAKQRLKPQYLRFKKAYRKAMGAFGLGRRIYRVTHRMKKAVRQALLASSIFEMMGFTYWGPVDGHDVGLLTRLLRYAKEQNEGPIVLHIKTVKGKGFAPAECNPDEFHGVGKFRAEDGTPLAPPGQSFSTVFGEAMCALAGQDGRVCAITAAMQTGTGLEQFSKEFPDRFFDVGIAEGHAVTMAAGMAKQGLIPVFAVYSSFLQRGYDMLLHDVAIQKLHVVLAVDRAGLVGEDGETHQGLFDVAFLSTVPGMTVYAPSCYAELHDMMRRAVLTDRGPVAVRYPRGGEGAWSAAWDGQAVTVARAGRDITLVTYGTLLNESLRAAQLLAADGIEAEVIKLNILPARVPAAALGAIQKTGRALVAEESVSMHCMGARIQAALQQAGPDSVKCALQNAGEHSLQQGTIQELRRLCGIDAQSLYRRALEVCRNG